jgi:hypothetical protein
MSKQNHSFVGDMVIKFLLRKNGDGWLAEQVEMHDVVRCVVAQPEMEKRRSPLV